MAALKSLLDAECGTTNPLVKLSQIYRHVPENGLNEQHESILVPNTFHLENLLTSLRASEQTTSKLGHQWAKEFLNTTSENIPSRQTSYTYLSPLSSFILHPHPLFLAQEPSLIDTGFDTDTVRATQNILSFLEERQLTVNTENQTSVNQVMTKKKEEERQLDKVSENINAFEAGLKCLEVHDIANAIVFFQAAVRKQPDHIDAWLCLGITQTKNEQDGSAIFALKKCIELDPTNLQAYITLASCYVNEMLKSEAFNSLYQWLANNKTYSHLLSTDSSYSTAYQQLTFEDLKDLFLQAVLCSNISNEIDADLQVCLGILFYLNNDYTKAAECFHTAVLARPSDALLWNKLGATMAIGGEHEKAVDAYYHALILSPGFIRARYNLGICCLNLKADKQAIEHFLIALKLQTNAVGIRAQMSENIWHTLASAIDRLKRADLEQCVVYRDLSNLLREFQIE